MTTIEMSGIYTGLGLSRFSSPSAPQPCFSLRAGGAPEVHFVHRVHVVHYVHMDRVDVLDEVDAVDEHYPAAGHSSLLRNRINSSGT